LQQGKGTSFEEEAGSKSCADASSPSGAGGSARARSTRKTATQSEEEARQALASSTKLYYRIGEVSELTGVKAHVLRYWETEFRWMAPPKSRSKQRLYRKRDIEFVWLLKKLLWEQRYTIAGARQRIKELGLEEALQNSDQTQEAPSARSESTTEASGDWVGIQAALESMQGELLALRGALLLGL
jgi:DNA-binding transcriptional MerR regulator